VSDPVRSISDQRRLLAATIRGSARWRDDKADEFDDDAETREENLRASEALLVLADFVEALLDDDRDLNLHALRRASERGGQLWLTPDGLTLLSRFGLDRGSWQAGEPSESQMRNVLRRVDGVEAKERRARKERADAGYGDD
jgi:hypothetical protein